MKFAPGRNLRTEAVPMEEIALQLLQFFGKLALTRTRNSSRERRGSQ